MFCKQRHTILNVEFAFLYFSYTIKIIKDMIKLEPGIKYLFVIDKDYYPLLFKYKNENPSINIKIIAKNSLIEKLGYSYSKDPVPYLITKKRLNYDKAKKMANLLRLLYKAENSPLKELETELKDYLTIDEYGEVELSSYKIYLFEMDEDISYQTLLTNHHLPYEFLHLSDLDIKKTDCVNTQEVIYFSDKFAQFCHIFSDIRQKIIEDPSLIKRLKILIKDNNDLFYINTLAKLFGIEIYTQNSAPLLSDPGINKLLKLIYTTKSFVINGEDKDSVTLKDLINQYQLDELDDFDFAFANLVEILSSNSFDIPSNDKGILVSSSFIFNPDDITYITNFEYGSFYREFSDNDIFNDSLLREYKLTTSYQRTSLEHRKKVNFLNYSNFILLSRVKQHLKDHIYDSQLISSGDFDFKGRIKEEEQAYEVNLNGLYTTEAMYLERAHRFDQRRFMGKPTYYKSYDHSFKPFNANELMDKGVWSVTDLEKYSQCPFKYYMSKLIPSLGDMHAAYKGTFVHSFLEDFFHPDFDFEVSFNRAKKAYIKSMENNNEVFSDKEEVWLQLYYHWLKQITPSLLKVKETMNLVPESKDSEIRIDFTIDKYTFKGYVDKVIYTQSDDKLYYSIIDYKTGSEEFVPESVPSGQSIQLPIYYSVLSENGLVKGEFGGFYIQHPFFKSIKKAFVDTGKFGEKYLLKNSRYTGVCKNDEDYIKSFDPTALEKQSDAKFLLRKYSFNQVDDDSLLYTDKNINVNHYSVNDIVEEAKLAAVETIEKILNNEFAIAPSSMEINKPLKLDNLWCKYCAYQDICFVNKKTDAKDYYDLIMERIKNRGGKKSWLDQLSTKNNN